jgi:hypothetical protein
MSCSRESIIQQRVIFSVHLLWGTLPQSGEQWRGEGDVGPARSAGNMIRAYPKGGHEKQGVSEAGSEAKHHVRQRSDS